ncbi:MAG TPA: glycosyltransferase family 9 protein [Myxococcota bacterium]|nr:glycosyltransferase family 9 protein [Myxococcota bacterium]
MPDARILVIRTGGLGDSLLLWPAVAAARQRRPAARLELLGHRGRLGLLCGPGGADAALEVEGSGLHHLYSPEAAPPAEVRARFGAYDVIVAFTAVGDCALAVNLSACGAGEVHAFLPRPPEGVHAAAHALDALVRAGLAAPGDASRAPPLPVPAGAVEQGRTRLAAAGLAPGRVALLAPGSGSPAKCWPAERFAALSALLARDGWRVALCGGPADADALAAAQAAARAAGAPATPTLTDQDPSELRALLAACELFVGNDSGPAHLAALLGRPTLVLFGPTQADTWRPLGPRVAIARGQAPCAPCAPERLEECGGRACFDGLGPEQACEAARRLTQAARETG